MYFELQTFQLLGSIHFVKFNPFHEVCPLYRDCPLLGGSVMGTSTVLQNIRRVHYCYQSFNTLGTSEEQTASQFSITDNLSDPNRHLSINFTSITDSPKTTPFYIKHYYIIESHRSRTFTCTCAHIVPRATPIYLHYTLFSCNTE